MRAAFLVVLAALSARPATAEPLEAPARIDRVTVSLGSAEVTRVAEVRVPAGMSQVRFAGIPEDADADSLVVRGHGVAAMLGAVELRTEVEEAAPRADLAAIDDRIARLQAETARLAAEDATDRDMRKYLDSLRDLSAARQVATESALQPNPASFAQMLAFLKSSYDEIAAREARRADRRREIQELLALEQARRATEGPASPTSTLAAIVDVDARDAGTLRLELSYVVDGASWRPTYRASLDAEASAVDLVSEAVVTQGTGEDWTDVVLRLTTSAPSRSLEAPFLASWVLAPQPVQAAGVGAGTAGQVQYRNADPATANMIDGGMAMQVPVGAIESFKIIASGASAKYGEQSTGVAEILTASMATGQQVSYVVPGRQDVGTDGAEHRVTLRTDTLPAKLAYVTTPALDRTAYAVATAHAPEDRPLLAGPVRVVASGAYLGEFAMAGVAPGGELHVAFGADARIEVTRTAAPPERGTSGRDRTVTQSARSTIVNRRDVPVRVTVKERIPVAPDEPITVKLAARTTEGYEIDDARPGILAWDLELQPKETREIEVEYAVRHPKDLVVPGL